MRRRSSPSIPASRSSCPATTRRTRPRRRSACWRGSTIPTSRSSPSTTAAATTRRRCSTTSRGAFRTCASCISPPTRASRRRSTPARCWRSTRSWSASTATRCSIRHALTWIVRRFQSDGGVGALTGNPRIRNRTSLLGRLQVGEFSSIVGLIKRAQTVYGRIFTVSGVICAFRKRALDDAGWWSPRTLTDDIDVTWRLQIAGWRVIFEPNAHRAGSSCPRRCAACGSSACAGPRAARRR